MLQHDPPVAKQDSLRSIIFFCYNLNTLLLYSSLRSSVITVVYLVRDNKRVPQSNIRNFVFIDKYYNKYSISSEKEGSPES